MHLHLIPVQFHVNPWHGMHQFDSGMVPVNLRWLAAINASMVCACAMALTFTLPPLRSDCPSSAIHYNYDLGRHVIWNPISTAHNCPPIQSSTWGECLPCDATVSHLCIVKWCCARTSKTCHPNVFHLLGLSPKCPQSTFYYCLIYLTWVLISDSHTGAEVRCIYAILCSSCFLCIFWVGKVKERLLWL